MIASNHVNAWLQNTSFGISWCLKKHRFYVFCICMRLHSSFEGGNQPARLHLNISWYKCTIYVPQERHGLHVVSICLGSSHSFCQDKTTKLPFTRVSICVRSSYSFRNTRKPNYLLNRSVWEALIVFSKTLQKNYLWHGAASVWGTLILFSRQENKLPLTRGGICVSSHSFLKTRKPNYLWHGPVSVWGALIAFSKTRKPYYRWHGSASVWGALMVFPETRQTNYFWHGAASVRGALIVFSETRQPDYLWHGAASRTSWSIMSFSQNT